MTRILNVYMDGCQSPVAGTVQNIGELLEIVDATLEPRGRIVTAVRIDGVDQPAFRDPACTSISLTNVERLDIASGTAGELALACLAEGISGLAAIAAACGDLAPRFRSQDIAGAHAALAEVVTGVASALTLVTAVAPHVRFAGGQHALDAVVSRTTATVETLIVAQQTRDWPAVAGALESDLPRALTDWIGVVETATVETTTA